MPIIKSAKKRVRVARKATVRNVKTKRNLKAAIKSLQVAIASKKGAAEAVKKAQSALDKAGKKNVMHKNKVARKQRQLAASAKAAGVKVIAGPKKVTAKSTAVKKSPTKPSTKTSTAKKTTAKKTTKK